MSHVTATEIEINDMAALERACAELGLEIVQKNTYRWFGRSVGDYPIPAGFTRADLGKCDFALCPKGERDNDHVYEIGVVKRDGKTHLLWDFWSAGGDHGGAKIRRIIGEGAAKLKQEYAVGVARGWAARNGYRLNTKTDAKGNRVVTMTK